MKHNWVNEFPGSVIVCDPQGIILEMNERAVQNYQKDGGRDLIGTNMLKCHPEPARTKTADLLARQGTNVYTIEKKGVRKLVYQSPWYEDGQFGGLVEIIVEIPEQMPHFKRGG